MGGARRLVAGLSFLAEPAPGFSMADMGEPGEAAPALSKASPNKPQGWTPPNFGGVFQPYSEDAKGKADDDRGVEKMADAGRGPQIRNAATVGLADTYKVKCAPTLVSRGRRDLFFSQPPRRRVMRSGNVRGLDGACPASRLGSGAVCRGKGPARDRHGPRDPAFSPTKSGWYLAVLWVH